MSSLKERTLFFLAVVFHPALLYTLVFSRFGTPFENFFEALAKVFALTFLVPFLLTRVLYKDIFLNKKSTRNIPLLFTAFFYALTTFLLQDHINGLSWYQYLLSMMPLSISIGLIIIFFINLKYKISLHGYGVGTLWAMIIIGSLGLFDISFEKTKNFESERGIYVLTFIVIFSILALFQRKMSGSHTTGQIISGTTLGVATSLLYCYIIHYLHISYQFIL